MLNPLVQEDVTYNSLHLHGRKLGDVSYDDQIFNENLFLEKVSPHLKCSVCLDVMQQPVQCPSGHSFCKTCMTKVLHQNKACPICRVPLSGSHLVVNRAVEGVIQDLLLRCPTTLDCPEEIDNISRNIGFRQEGDVRQFSPPLPDLCAWTGHLHACQAHLLVCSRARVHCPQPHCDLSFPRDGLLQHSQSCGSSPSLFFHLYCRVRCGDLSAWEQLQNFASISPPLMPTSSHALAQGYTALVLIQSHISIVPRDLRRAQELIKYSLRGLRNYKDPEKKAEMDLIITDTLPNADKDSDNDYFPHASFILGALYLAGIGVPHRPSEAFALFSSAAKEGHSGSQCSLGLCYDQGTGTEPNIQLAVKWYMLAAEQGYAPALLNLGMCSYHGEGMKKDRAVALDYYDQAARLGNATALFNLGVCLSSGVSEKEKGNAKGGRGGELEMGVRLVRRAALQGYEEAQQYLEKHGLSLYH